MKLLLERYALKKNYTIGRLFIDGVKFCDTLEPQVRDLRTEPKVHGKTAIPEGTYDVVVTISPKFKRLLPHILGVPGFSGIRIHRGNTAADTAGCPLVGENRIVGRVVNSTKYELEITSRLRAAQERNEKISITIARK